MKKKINKILRNGALIKFNLDEVRKEYIEKYKEDYPFSESDKFIYLGEIPNMAGHCSVIRTKDNRLFFGYHLDDFIELSDDEV